jgi:hypothetical protein
VAFPTHLIYRRGKGKSRARPLLPLWAFVACSKVTFTFTFTSYHASPAVVTLFSKIKVRFFVTYGARPSTDGLLCSYLRNKLSGPEDGGVIFLRNFRTTWCKHPEHHNLKKEYFFLYYIFEGNKAWKQMNVSAPRQDCCLYCPVADRWVL